jgi:predicted MFS family arabinose efflux permease
MILVTNLIESPLLIVLTVYAREVLDSSVALGVLFGVFSVGAIAGSMASGAVAARVPGRWILPITFSGIVILYGALIIEPPFATILAVALGVGLMAGPFNPFLDTVFQQRVPSRMRGRVFGLRSALMMSATPLGVLAGGALISAAGIRTTLVVQVIAMLLAIGWMMLSPTLRELGRD